METILTEFVNTLDLSLKRLQEQAGEGLGFYHLTINQFRYIDAIGEMERITITALAEKLHITKASVTAGVEKLKAMGYVTKTRSEQDKRVQHVRLTETGLRLVDAKRQALKEYEDLIRLALNEEERLAFEASLAKIVKVFNQGK